MIFDKHLKSFVTCLFNTFPRDAGFPARVSKYNQSPTSFKEFYALVAKKHSYSPSFIQLYQTDKQTKIEKTIIDKLWIDFDGKNYYGVYKDYRTIYNRLQTELEVDINHIFPVFTGGKGYHNYLLNKPSEFTSEQLQLVLEYLTRDLEHIDSPIFSDLNRMVRVSGVQRPNNAFCISIDPIDLFDKSEDFNDYFKRFDYSWNKMFKHSTKYLVKRINNQYTIDGKNNNRNYIQEILDIIEDKNWEPPREIVSKQIKQKFNQSKQHELSTNDVINDFLLDVLGKKLFYSIRVPNPIHDDRLSYARKMLKTRLSISTIVKITRQLNWVDFNAEKTEFFLRDFKNRYL